MDGRFAVAWASLTDRVRGDEGTPRWAKGGCDAVGASRNGGDVGKSRHDAHVGSESPAHQIRQGVGVCVPFPNGLQGTRRRMVMNAVAD